MGWQMKATTAFAVNELVPDREDWQFRGDLGGYNGQIPWIHADLRVIELWRISAWSGTMAWSDRASTSAHHQKAAGRINGDQCGVRDRDRVS